jgi:hypothetical protein
MASGALPRPGRVPKQRLLSPKICRWQRRSCGTLPGNLPIVLGFSVGRLFIGEEASSEVDHGHLTMWQRGLGGAPPHGEPALWPPPALFRSSSFVREK